VDALSDISSAIVGTHQWQQQPGLRSGSNCSSISLLLLLVAVQLAIRLRFELETAPHLPTLKQRLCGTVAACVRFTCTYAESEAKLPHKQQLKSRAFLLLLLLHCRLSEAQQQAGGACAGHQCMVPLL
jgi:hypothetical protein